MLKYVADQLPMGPLYVAVVEDESTPNTMKDRDSVEGETLKYELPQQVQFLSPALSLQLVASSTPQMSFLFGV